MAVKWRLEGGTRSMPSQVAMAELEAEIADLTQLLGPTVVGPLSHWDALDRTSYDV